MTIRDGLLCVESLSRPDQMERDDAPFGRAAAGGFAAVADAPVVAVRVVPRDCPP